MAALKETVGDIQQVMDWIREAKDRSINSLTEYTKKTLISSRAYIESSLVREDGILPIMKFVNQMLSGFVFTAIGMNNLATGGRTVREMAASISTEDFHDIVDLIKEKFGDKNVTITAGLEGNEGDQKKTAEVNNKGTKQEVQQVDTLFTGRLVEVKIADGKGHEIPFYFYVQISPFTAPTEVLEQFIVSNFPPDKASRWAKFKAGEIKFWRDFIFECDLVAKRRKALKADKDGILREMEDRKQAQIVKAAAAMSPIAQKNHNSASSIIVISRRSIDRMMKDNGLDYKRYDVRQKIMTSTMAMMLVVYDPNYNTVDLYMNGIQNAGNYSLEMIKESVGKGSKDAIDLKTLMTILSSGNAPRF